MGRKRRGDSVCAGFERLLVHAMMGVSRKCGALAGFKIHEVIADATVGTCRAAMQRPARFVRFGKQRQIDSEAAVGGLGAGDGLKDKIDRGTGFKSGHQGGDMGQHAALRGNLKPLADCVDQAQQARGHGHIVTGGIDADDRVARAEQQAVQNGGGDSGSVVRGWLGCRRVLSLPGSPTEVRKRVTTRILAAAAIRSCTRMSLLTAAAISGVNPGASAARRPAVASSESSQSRNSPTVNERTGAKAVASCVSTISRVTSSSS